MRSKNEIPNKYDFLKQHSFNFLLNEKYFSDVVHEKNVNFLEKVVAKDSGRYLRDLFTFLFKWDMSQSYRSPYKINIYLRIE